jgi:hypothetical protein
MEVVSCIFYLYVCVCVWSVFYFLCMDSIGHGRGRVGRSDIPWRPRSLVEEAEGEGWRAA